MKFQKVRGIEHCADLMAKELDESEMIKNMKAIGAKFQEGSAYIAAKVVSGTNIKERAHG